MTTQSHVKHIADVRSLVFQAGMVVMGAVLLALLAQVRVPLLPVPVTMQTFTVLALGGLLGWKLGLSAVALYIFAGLCGLPVFTGWLPGAAMLAKGTTIGFIIGFLPAAAVCGIVYSRFAGREYRVRFAGAFLAATIGAAIILLFGWVWLAWAVGLGAQGAFLAGVAPFVLIDVAKSALVASIVAARKGML